MLKIVYLLNKIFRILRGIRGPNFVKDFVKIKSLFKDL